MFGTWLNMLFPPRYLMAHNSAVSGKLILVLFHMVSNLQPYVWGKTNSAMFIFGRVKTRSLC